MMPDNNVEAIENKFPLIPRRKLLHKQSKSPAVFKLPKKRIHTLSLGRRSSPGYSLKKITNFHNYRYSSNFQQWKASLLTLNFKSLVLTTLFPIRSANIVKTVTSSVEPPYPSATLAKYICLLWGGISQSQTLKRKKMRNSFKL